MKHLYIALALFISGAAFGQIEQNVNKTMGTVSKPITEIDSIRFNMSTNQMEIIQTNGNTENHSIIDITNVTFSGQLVGAITELNCDSAHITGTLTAGVSAIGISFLAPYTGGNGGPHNGQILNSTGVTGLTATLVADTFALGADSLNYIISGTPSAIGTAIFDLNIGGQSCSLNLTVGEGAITELKCDSNNNKSALIEGLVVAGLSIFVTYTGGNGGPHNGQIVNSTGVTGLTATLVADTFALGADSLNYIISGTPSAIGTAIFDLNIGGQSCSLSIATVSYPFGSVNCTGVPTAVVDVSNPSTGKIWMDRNLGAGQIATSTTDSNAFGDLYQWGRRADGHQCRNSGTTGALSSIDQPNHGDFILTNSSPNNWRSPQNTNLWQGLNGINNPCPSGYRVPTESELNAERLTWSTNDLFGAFNSPLKLPIAGYRFNNNGTLVNVGSAGNYWSSTVSNNNSLLFFFFNSDAYMFASARSHGVSVRCIKD